MFKEKSEQMYPVMGGKKPSGGIKGCKVFKEKPERYITSRNGWVSLKGIFRWYICRALVCYITSRDGGVTQGDFRWYRCRRDPGTV